MLCERGCGRPGGGVSLWCIDHCTDSASAPSLFIWALQYGCLGCNWWSYSRFLKECSVWQQPTFNRTPESLFRESQSLWWYMDKEERNRRWFKHNFHRLMWLISQTALCCVQERDVCYVNSDVTQMQRRSFLYDLKWRIESKTSNKTTCKKENRKRKHWNLSQNTKN